MQYKNAGRLCAPSKHLYELLTALMPVHFPCFQVRLAPKQWSDAVLRRGAPFVPKVQAVIENHPCAPVYLNPMVEEEQKDRGGSQPQRNQSKVVAVSRLAEGDLISVYFGEWRTSAQTQSILAMG